MKNPYRPVGARQRREQNWGPLMNATEIGAEFGMPATAVGALFARYPDAPKAVLVKSGTAGRRTYFRAAAVRAWFRQRLETKA